MQTFIQVLRYWRNSLIEAELNDPSSTSELIDITYTEFSNGQILSHNMGRLLEPTSKETSRYKVLLSPFVFDIPESKGFSSGKLNRFYPLWVPAEVDENGKLLPSEQTFPWMVRALLEPAQRICTFGDLSDYISFLAQNSEAKLEIWEDVLWYTNKLFSDVAGESLHTLEGCLVKNYSCVCLGESVPRTVWSMNLVLEYLLHTPESIPPLLQTYINLTPIPSIPLITKSDRSKIIAAHIAQMGNEFSLSPNQREALDHFLISKPGEILAVNGPPGTGKTTLIHSIIANMWVEAALRQDKNPPIIVATSTNNQAVTNIIDSFGKITNTTNPLAKRWIPDLKSYGLYCLRNKNETLQDALSKGLHAINRNADFINSNWENKGFLNSAENYYLSCFNNYFNEKITTLDNAINYLHAKLIEIVQKTKVVASNILLIGQLKEQIQTYNENIAALENQFIGITKQVDSLKENYRNKEHELNLWHEHYQEWCNHQKKMSFSLKYFSFLPGIKKKLDEATRSFIIFSRIPLSVENIQTVNITNYILDQAQTKKLEQDTLNEQINYYKNKQRHIKDNLHQLAKIKTDLSVKLEDTSNYLSNYGNSYEKILEKLDITNRYNAFLLATHYWEGRWILTTREYLKRNPNKLTSQVRNTEKWYRYAMLMPCIVSTLYMVPSFFYYAIGTPDNRYPMLEYIDLLIIDEAGQITPEKAAAAIALSKKAVVLGDEHQIAPVRNITEDVDRGNMVRHGLTNNKDGFSVFIETHNNITVSTGTVLGLAQSACSYQKFFENGDPYPERGMFLSEHRRCQAPIISYCNELCYGNRLEILTKPFDTANRLPYIGYARVVGKGRKFNGSRINEIEAQTILAWIYYNKDYIAEVYGYPVSQTVAVLTPFTQQKIVLQKIIKDSYPIFKDMTVGTVHALQGAEREIIIFSPVYTKGTYNQLFFDSDPSILNVATSRAKKSFLVFGDMSIFQSEPVWKPSALLAKRLFESSLNEIHLEISLNV